MARKYEYKLGDVDKLCWNFIQKTINKRYEKVEERIKKKVKEEAEKLFKIMVGDEKGAGKKVIDTWKNPFNQYSRAVWKKLDDSYLKRKKRKGKSTNFWSYEKKLENWLREASPRSVFGPPVVITQRNTKARGLQNMRFQIIPYPWTYASIADEDIGNRLFARRHTKYGYVSNEDMRPIVNPSMRHLLNYRIKRSVREIFSEVIKNG